MRYVIEGEMTAVTPMHIASGEGNVRYDFKTGRKIYGPSGGVPLTTTQHKTIVLPEKGGTMQVPGVNANTLRGGIRRAGARVVARMLADKGEAVSNDTMLRMLAGTSSGRPSKEMTGLDEMDEIFNNPFVGLFGGGERMHRSRFVCCDGWPMLDELVELGTIPSDAQTMESRKGLTSVLVLRRVNDILRNLASVRENFEAAVKDFNAEAQRIIEDAAERTKRKKQGEEASADDSMLDSINALEIVNPGTRFYVRFEANGAAHHAGMLLKALEEFVSTDNVGGWGRNDFGRVRFDLHVRAEDEHEPVPAFGPDGRLSPDVKPYLDALDEASGEINAEKLERLLA